MNLICIGHHWDCVGEIDGTHIQASVPIELQERFRGRKERTPQNVLAGITFDVKCTYALAGWEGSAHDSCVLNNALIRRLGSKFLKVYRDKRYVLLWLIILF